MFYDGKAGSRIKEYRQKHTPFKQADMAEMLNIELQAYEHIERDLLKRFDPEILLHIADILGTSVDFLLDGQERSNTFELSDSEKRLILMIRQEKMLNL